MMLAKVAVESAIQNFPTVARLCQVGGEVDADCVNSFYKHICLQFARAMHTPDFTTTLPK